MHKNFQWSCISIDTGDVNILQHTGSEITISREDVARSILINYNILPASFYKYDILIRKNKTLYLASNYSFTVCTLPFACNRDANTTIYIHVYFNVTSGMTPGKANNDLISSTSLLNLGPLTWARRGIGVVFEV